MISESESEYISHTVNNDFQIRKGFKEPPTYYIMIYCGSGAVVRVVRVERPDLVRSVQELHANSLSQYLSCFLLEAVQLVSLPHFLQAGAGGT